MTEMPVAEYRQLRQTMTSSRAAAGFEPDWRNHPPPCRDSHGPFGGALPGREPRPSPPKLGKAAVFR
jgi:hypothetical protein